MACSIGEGDAVLYRLHGVLRELTDDDGGHGAPGDQRRGRGHGGVQSVRAIVMRVLAQWEVVKNSWAVRRPLSRLTAVVVVHGGSRSSASQRAGLAGSWR